MSTSKHFDKIAWTVIALTLVITILFMNGALFGIEVKAHTMGYEQRLFDNSKVHTIDIVMNNWDEFIDNATSEQYYTAAVVIDGESYKNVAIRGKGNTSLSTVSSLGSERYSFKIEFDHYDNSLTYHGLDKLSLNNLIQDSTMMKDYLTYTMMNEFDVNAPLCSFVYITVNGRDWGLYIAVEGVEDSFLERNYGSDYGELYKPDSMSFGGGRGNGKDFDIGDLDLDFSWGDSSTSDGSTSNGSTSKGSSSQGFNPFGGSMPSFTPDSQTRPDSSSGSQRPQSGFDSSSLPEDFDSSSIPEDFDISSMFGDMGSFGNMGGMMGGFGMGSSDVKLQYIDDNISSYSNIWNNAKTDITEADQMRLIASLKQLSQYSDVSSVVDVEQVIRYFVVHNYVCNGDSYTGTMVHNYYLYEQDGQLAMIPWDYNLGFGTFSASNATSTVNTPIDNTASDRPMLNWIFEDEQYTELYHQYFAEFIGSVDIDGIISSAYELIAPYVQKDPTAFYSYEEFQRGVETLRAFCSMRSESITLQLQNGQTTSNMSYVDASSITLSDMGSMGGGMGGGFDRGNKKDNSPNGSEDSNGDNGVTASDGEQTGIVPTSFFPSDGSFPSGGSFPGDGQIPSDGSFPSGGQFPSDGSFPSGGQFPSDGSFPSGGQFPNGGQFPSGGSFPSGGQFPSDGSFPSNGSSSNEGSAAENNSSSGNSTARPQIGNSGIGTASDDGILLIVSILVLAAGITFAALFKRRR